MMRRLPISALLSAFVLLLATKAYAEDASRVFAHFKAASGDTRWDGVHSLQSTGALSAGGLKGEFHEVQDLVTGRSSSSYKIGPVDGAQGYNGTHAWERDPGGEVAVLDAPEAVRRARNQVWLDARAYWYPQRIAATYGKVETRELDGKQFSIIEATPEGGNPVTLWIATDTGLLARIVQRQGEDTATTVLDDYRDVDGVRLPFHTAIDQTDAAGRTDARRHEEIQLDRISANIALSDSDFAIPAMAATARIDDANGITRIPFDLVNNHIYVDGAVDGKPARFMVDTGGVNLLTPAAAKKFGLASEGKMAAGGAGEQRTDLALARAKQVRVGAATLANPVFYVVDLGDLPKAEGVTLDGLVGYEMFRRFGVQINYAKKQLTLSDPKRFVPLRGAAVLAFDFDDHMPIISGVLDNVPVRITVDTGSRDSLTMSSPFVHAHDLIAKYDAAPESVTGWGVGGAAHGRPARLGTLRLGDLNIDGIAGDLFIGDKGGFTNPDQAGNLGGGVLRRFTVAFDYANKKMYLAPNADFGKPDTFDRSGLWLLADGDTLKVADVAKNSTAERAGMCVNDRISAIGGVGISAKPLAEWRQQLRELPVGTKLAVRFQRDGKDGDATLALTDRIPAAAK
jgi:hypothetical protein